MNPNILEGFTNRLIAKTESEITKKTAPIISKLCLVLRPKNNIPEMQSAYNITGIFMSPKCGNKKVRNEKR